MKQKILKVFTQIQAQRSDIISLFEGLTEDQLLFRPEPGHWNLLQVMRHLVTAEVQSMVLIRRRLSHHEKYDKAGIGSSVRFLLLKSALILPIKYKAPKIAQVDDEYPDMLVMKQEWDDSRRELIEIIENTEPTILAKEIYRHPRAGGLNLIQAMKFIKIHIAHHKKQIGRIINHTDFPG